MADSPGFAPDVAAPASPSALDPITAARRLLGARGRVLLHSASDIDELGKHSFVAAEPAAVLIARGRSLVRLDARGRPVRRFSGDPLAAAEVFLAEHGCTLQLAGGAPAPRVVGYFSYDLARVLDGMPAGPRDPGDRASLGDNGPDLWLAAYGAFARWSPPAGSNPADAGGPDIVGPDPAARDQLARLLARPTPPSLPPSFSRLVSDDDAAHHMARVERVRDYLAAGDVYQVNLARRLVARVAAPGDPLAIYAALTQHASAPYGALIEADGLTVISGSPERFLTSVADPRGHRIETRPIKGTAAPGVDAARALAGSPKDAAEHLMIVDLERNDLGRIAATGSVRVDQLGYVVQLPTLCHLVSRVSATPRPDVGYADLLRATFPGGSITGAPKLRAMQLIDELEPVRRGAYCGAFGYFGPTGFDLALAIRIGVLIRDELRIHVGGGIVTDSDPAAELAETDLKAAAWRSALAYLDQLRHQPPR
jgi:para-aminobenzoate synthetase component 1